VEYGEYNVYQYRLPENVKVNCDTFNYVREWWRVKKVTTTAALAAPGDCDPL